MKDIFTPSTLITVTPSNFIGNETYHYPLDNSDLIIRNTDLEAKLKISDNILYHQFQDPTAEIISLQR